MAVKLKIFVLFLAIWQQTCHSQHKSTTVEAAPAAASQTIETDAPPLRVGADRLEDLLPLTTGKRLGLVVNQTSMVRTSHLVDTLLDRYQRISCIFAPEHGFRGDADAGEKVTDGKDPRTGIPIISLYGKHKKPRAADLADVDVLLFDIQDVGARFYTYLSTLHYVMEAAAEHGVPIIVLDRPNPNGHYVDGPILEPAYRSFVGMHPVPVVHGMTVGEYARMINGEGWLAQGRTAELRVISCQNYTHQTVYELPVPPSPNLPNMRAVYLYPSLCFFEGTVFSVGRGTHTQFQVYGHPDFLAGNYQFTPRSGYGAKYPKLEGQLCRGVSLVERSPAEIRAEGRLNLQYLLHAYRHYPRPADFFLDKRFIDKLAGGPRLREQILAGLSEAEIRASWQEGLQDFQKTRSKYLLYE